MIEIQTATNEDAKALSDLAFRSKAHWGYDEKFMELCREELTLSPEECDSGNVRVGYINSKLVGFYQISGEPPKGELENLFVEPNYIGWGIGRLLLESTKEFASDNGFKRLEIVCDPHAEPFYKHMGAYVIGEVTSESIPNRKLPLLVLSTQTYR